VKLHWGWTAAALALGLVLCVVEIRLSVGRTDALVSSLSDGYRRRIISERERAAIDAADELLTLRAENARLARALRNAVGNSANTETADAPDPDRMEIGKLLADLVADELQYSYGRGVVISCVDVDGALFVTVARAGWDKSSKAMRDAMVLSASQMWRAARCVPDRDMALVIFRTEDGKIVGSSSKSADGKLYRSITSFDYKGSSTMIGDLGPIPEPARGE